MVEMVPAVAADTVVLGTRGGAFLALDLKDGHLKWRRKEGNGAFGSSDPVVAYGTVFIGDRGVRDPERTGVIHAFDLQTGKRKWSQAFGATGLSTPGVMPEHILVGFGRSVGALHVETGHWSPDVRIRCGPNAFGSPTLIGSTIYFGNLDGHLYAIDRQSGSLKWAFHVGKKQQASDFAYWKGTIFLATTKGIYAIGNDPGRGDAPHGLILRPEARRAR